MSRFTTLFILSLLTILGLRFYLFYSHLPTYKDGQLISFETTLLSEPQIISRYQKFTANLSDGTRILVTLPVFPEFHYGDTVHIDGPVKFSKRSNFSNKNRGVINNNRIVLSMFFPKIKAVKNRQTNMLFSTKSILAITSFIRQNTVTFFEKTLPSNSAHLLLGIVFGIKEDFSKDFYDNLKIAGVLHVVAASGMNVSMVGGFLSSFFMLFAKRRFALILTCFGIFFYALLAGFEPSIIRAAIMGTLAFSSQILGKQYLAAYSLFMAAFVMLFISPYLISDIGFQLSFLATLGLLYLRPLLGLGENQRRTLFQSFVVNSEIKTTLAAQLATLPILLVNFGSYSVFSILANAFVLWLVPTLMVLGGLASLTGLILEPSGKIFLYLSLPFLIYFEKIVSFFAGFGQIDLNFPWQFAIGYYLILLAIVFYLKSKKEIKNL